MQKIIRFRVFEGIIVFVIILNSISLGMFDYSDRDSESLWNQVLDIASFVFTIIFLAESVLKILALGLI